ncbi:unnamed protein product [Prunus armeniaca]
MEIREDIGDQSSEGGSGVNFHKPILRPSSLGSGVGGRFNVKLSLGGKLGYERFSKVMRSYLILIERHL